MRESRFRKNALQSFDIFIGFIYLAVFEIVTENLIQSLLKLASIFS